MRQDVMRAMAEAIKRWNVPTGRQRHGMNHMVESVGLTVLSVEQRDTKPGIVECRSSELILDPNRESVLPVERLPKHNEWRVQRRCHGRWRKRNLNRERRR